MTVSNIQHKSSVTLTTEDGKNTAIVTKWKVTFKASSTFSLSNTKTYHVVILSEHKRGYTGLSALKKRGTGSSAVTSAYVTNTIPKKNDLSRSTLHVETDSNTEVLKDHTGKIMCSFDRANSVDLGFAIEPAEFDRVRSISEGLIGQLGEFLRVHLSAPEKKAPEVAAAPSAKGAGKAPTAVGGKDEAKAEEEEERKAPEKPKGLIRSGLSALSGRVAALGSFAKSQVTCNRVGVIVMLAVPAILSYYINNDSGFDQSSLNSL